MNIAVLIRGFHFLNRDRFGFPMNGLRYLDSLEQCVLAPLRKEHQVKVFVVTYPSPDSDAVMNVVRPESEVMLDSKTSNQVGTFLRGIDLVSDAFPDCDKVISTRFDLTYRKSVAEWNIWREEKGIYFPWREYETLWNQHHRVGDAIHVIDKGFVGLFRDALDQQRTVPDLHRLYDVLASKTDRLMFIEDGFYDSNTLYSNAECSNPLYRMGGRPRVPARQPYRIPPAGRIELRWTAFVTDVASEVSRLKRDLSGPGRTSGVPGLVGRVFQSAGGVAGAAWRAVKFNPLRLVKRVLRLGA